MNIDDAKQGANQVLDDERICPTVRYVSPSPHFGTAVPFNTPFGQRGQNPRPVSNVPGNFILESTNYNLLVSFYSRIPAPDKSTFVASVRDRIAAPDSFRVIGQDVLGAGSLKRTSSELPLVAEFLVRHGDVQAFFQFVKGCAPQARTLTLTLPDRRHDCF